MAGSGVEQAQPHRHTKHPSGHLWLSQSAWDNCSSANFFQQAIYRVWNSSRRVPHWHRNAVLPHQRFSLSGATKQEQLPLSMNHSQKSFSSKKFQLHPWRVCAGQTTPIPLAKSKTGLPRSTTAPQVWINANFVGNQLLSAAGPRGSSKDL